MLESIEGDSRLHPRCTFNFIERLSMTLALIHLQQVGLQDSWTETVQVINHVFPWIDLRNVNRVTASTLRPDLLMVLVEQNQQA